MNRNKSKQAKAAGHMYRSGVVGETASGCHVMAFRFESQAGKCGGVIAWLGKICLFSLCCSRTSYRAAMGALYSPAKLHPSFVAASTLKQIQHGNLTRNKMASD